MKFTLFNRILATIYDVIIQLFILLGVYIITNVIHSKYFSNDVFKTVLFIVLVCVVAFIYFGLLPLKLKGTIGKYMSDLEVIATSGHFTLGRWLFREIIFKYVYPYLGVFLFISLNKFTINHLIIYLGVGFTIQLLFIILKRKTIHDYILKTKVINKEIVE